MLTAGGKMDGWHGRQRGGDRGSAGGTLRTTMSDPALFVRLLGPPAVTRHGVAVALPPSRKVRAMLAFLALSPGPQSRSRLCDLLWDVPSDPRGELRWCLSKLRGLLDDADRHRVVTDDQLVALDLSDCRVDALEVDRALQMGIGQASDARLAELCGLFGGDLLDGLQIDGNPTFTGWLASQRNRYRAMHVALLGALATRPAEVDQTFRRLDAWLQRAPFDPRAHQVMLETLVKCGRLRDGEEHLAATIRSFEEEGVDWSPLRDGWRAAREAAAPAPRIETPAAPVVAVEARSPRRASVAVMPFVDRIGGPSQPGRVADGLTEDIIMQLAKLRVLFVIARGTVFALADRGIGPQEAADILKVDYVTSGSVRRDGQRITVAVELSDARDGRIVWTDALNGMADQTFSVLDAIVERIVAAIAEEIESTESQRAVLKAPSSLDAWEAHHRGLWHMYKFNGADNRHAEGFFRAALELDPTFARAHAGLSFTHFQNAFLHLTHDRDRQIALAFETAGHSLAADDQDPAAHWAMGRALWLRGAQDQSLAELQRSIELSPNFALGHYTLGFVQSQNGDPRAAIESTNHSRRLSPFDPLQFAMLASRALAHVRLDQHEEAADWAVKATARPNAHEHILAIAAECLALTGRREEAGRFVAQIRQRLPGYSVEDFLRAFRFAPETEQLFRSSARQIGFGS
jgi:DNA-binding SARP family transcriptional activator/Tfp pilus assembly protein PilF